MGGEGAEGGRALVERSAPPAAVTIATLIPPSHAPSRGLTLIRVDSLVRVSSQGEGHGPAHGAQSHPACQGQGQQQRRPLVLPT